MTNKRPLLQDLSNPLTRKPGQAAIRLSKDERQRVHVEILGWIAEDPTIRTKQLRVKVKELYPASGWSTIDSWIRKACHQHVEKRERQVYADFNDSIAFYTSVRDDLAQNAKNRMQAQRNLDMLTGARWLKRAEHDKAAAKVTLNVTLGQILGVLDRAEKQEIRLEDRRNGTDTISNTEAEAAYQRLVDETAEQSVGQIMHHMNQLDALERREEATG